MTIKYDPKQEINEIILIQKTPGRKLAFVESIFFSCGWLVIFRKKVVKTQNLMNN